MKLFNRAFYVINKPIPLPICSVLVLLFLGLFYEFCQPIINQDLLIRKETINKYLLLIVFSDYTLETSVFLLIHIMCLTIFIPILFNMWICTYERNKHIYIITKYLFTLMFLTNIILISMNYAFLAQAKLYKKAAIPAEPASPVLTGSAALVFRKH